MANRPSQLPAGGGVGGSRPGGGNVNRPSQLPAGGGIAGRPGGGAVGNRPGGGAVNRPSQLPAGGGIAGRPGNGAVGNRPSTLPSRPGRSDLGNFLGAAAGGAAGSALGGALANRPTQLPADRLGNNNGPIRDQTPEQRPNWDNWSQNRDERWQQRVDNANGSWNNWQDRNQDRLNDFQNNREQRWDNLESGREDRQNWRDETREDWQNHREEMWDYRSDRANEIWDNAEDYYNDVFDDHWWGSSGWGYGYGAYPANPWWWWVPATYAATAAFVHSVPPQPAYIDYGMNVVYEGDTVYVDNKPMPAKEYTQPMVDLATNVEQPPPPTPPAEGKEPEWLPLGVYALAQEEKGDPVMFFQLSVNRAGVISGAYDNPISNDQQPVAGQVDQASQRVAWRIGDSTDTIFITSLANLTENVAPISLTFSGGRTQTWLLVRMPEPSPDGKQVELPLIDVKPPPLKTATTVAK